MPSGRSLREGEMIIYLGRLLAMGNVLCARMPVTCRTYFMVLCGTQYPRYIHDLRRNVWIRRGFGHSAYAFHEAKPLQRNLFSPRYFTARLARL